MSAEPAAHSEFSAIDHAHMTRALRLAVHGLYTTQPNPRVGCVLAHGDEVVGEGWHQRAGEAHAEVFALGEAGSRARGATAYVSLEPCAHHGRTPPCADALLDAGVARVVSAIGDSNPEVAGRGLKRLRGGGVVVQSGLLADPAWELNRGFFSRLERSRPWVRLKLASSLDGRTALADGRSKWISGAAARADVARWRARSSALLSSSATVRADDPRLTVRLPAQPGPDARQIDFVPPLRVVLDANLSIPATAQVLDGRVPTLLLHANGATPTAHHGKVECVAVAADRHGLDLSAALALLAERGVNELQVEAGPTLCGALCAGGLVDELLLYMVPILLGDSALPLLQLPALADMSAAPRWSCVDSRCLGGDQRLLLRPHAELR